MPRILRPGRLLVSALVALSLLLPSSAALADEDGTTPSPSVGSTVDDATVLAAKSYPGVQLIATTYSARVTVQIPILNQAAVDALVNRLAVQVLTGGIDSTEEALTEEIVDAVVKSPNTYFLAGPRTYSRRNRLVGVGTGWAITPDGYMITAAHVVDTPDAQLRQEFAASSLSRLGQQFIRGLRRSGTALTNDQVSRLTDTIMGWLAGHMAVTGLRVSVAAQLAIGIEGIGKEQKSVTAEVVDKGKPYPGSDVALLKIDGQEHMPTLPIGSNDTVSPGSAIHIVGFPAASTFSAGLSRDAQVQPTVTEGPVTAIKSTRSGMPVFQTQAPASPGNSGGPVLTDDGSSVGVLVANAVENNGVAAQGQNFVIPASEVLDMLERNGVTPEESDTTATYADAVDAYYADRFKEALPLFEKVQSLYPAHPFAQKFITDSKTAIDEGRDKTPEPEEDSGRMGLILAALGAGLVVLLLAGLGLWLLMRRRQPAAPGGGGYLGQPGVPEPTHPMPQAAMVQAPMHAHPVPSPAAAPEGLMSEAPVSQASVPQAPAPQAPAGPTSPPPQPLWDPDRGWYLPDPGAGEGAGEESLAAPGGQVP